MTTTLAPLTAAELTDLGRLETVIETGLATFVAVGRALVEIFTRQLYQATHGRWEDYCTGRWGFSRQHAFRLMQTVEVVKNLLPTGDMRPQNERVCRPLAGLTAGEQQIAWTGAVKRAAGRQPTAAQVQQSVDDLDLSPEEQAREIRSGQERARTAAASLERPDDRTRRLTRIGRNAEKARRAALGLDEAEREQVLGLDLTALTAYCVEQLAG